MRLLSRRRRTTTQPMFPTSRVAWPRARLSQRRRRKFERPSNFTWRVCVKMAFPFLPHRAKSNTSKPWRRFNEQVQHDLVSMIWPNSASSPRRRSRLSVRFSCQPCRSRCTTNRACCSTLFTVTKRSCGCRTAAHRRGLVEVVLPRHPERPHELRRDDPRRGPKREQLAGEPERALCTPCVRLRMTESQRVRTRRPISLVRWAPACRRLWATS
jgi:hypothetical protein